MAEVSLTCYPCWVSSPPHQGGRMAYTSTAILIAAPERSALEKNVRGAKTEQRLALRSRIILLAADGMGTGAIAAQLQTAAATVSKWRVRFAQMGLEGLADAPRCGAPGKYTKETELRILAKLDEPVPRGETVWTARLLGRELSVDEKPSIQALERAQGYLRFNDGRTYSGFSDRYRRNGTTTLFGALQVATGMVTTGHYKRRRRIEFLDFMNKLIRQYSEDQEIHVILDNLSTHTKKGGTWLARHPQVHFHFTPTGASWLNQIEVWFSILTVRLLRNGSFTSGKELRDAIDRFTRASCEDCSPFAWTKEKVHQVTLKRRYADLCK